MEYSFGFSWKGFIIVLLPMIPNFFHFLFPNTLKSDISKFNFDSHNAHTVTEYYKKSQVYNLGTFTAPKFQEKYLKLNENNKLLLQTLIKKCAQFCLEHFATNMPDYRLANKVNFCLITLLVKEQKIRIHIRTDGLLLSSSILNIKKLPNHHYNGKEWIEIIIYDSSQVDEAVRLIKQTYDYHS